MPMRRASSVADCQAGSRGPVATFAALSAPTAARAASDFKVVVTIKPLHALVAQVMAGVGSPELLVKGAASPHTFTLRPSEVRALNSRRPVLPHVGDRRAVHRAAGEGAAQVGRGGDAAGRPRRDACWRSGPAPPSSRTRTASTGTTSITTLQRRARARPSTAMPGSTPTTPRPWSGASSRRWRPSIPSTPPPSGATPRLCEPSLDALAAELDGDARAARRQALHRLPRCAAVSRAPLRPQRRGLDHDQPRGAAERQAAARAAPQDPVASAPCACSSSRRSTRASSTT